MSRDQWRRFDVARYPSNDSGYLFFAVMLGHILLISEQVNSRTGVPVLEAVTFGVFAEVQRGIVGGVVRASGASGAATSRCGR